MYAAADDVRHLRPHIEAQLESIQVLRKNYPAEQQEIVCAALAHTGNVLKLKPEVDALVNELLDILNARRYGDLYQAYQRLDDARAVEVTRYRTALYVGSILLLGYILIHLKQSRQNLEATNSELNFQKYALDRHAIASVADAGGTITYVNDMSEAATFLFGVDKRSSQRQAVSDIPALPSRQGQRRRRRACHRVAHGGAPRRKNLGGVARRRRHHLLCQPAYSYHGSSGIAAYQPGRKSYDRHRNDRHIIGRR